MILQKRISTGGLLAGFKFRKAGQMDKDGKLISWGDAHQIILLPFEDEKGLRKYTVDPICVDEISKKLEAVHWGCLIEMDISNNLVTDVTVIEDVLNDFYEKN